MSSESDAAVGQRLAASLVARLRSCVFVVAEALMPAAGSLSTGFWCAAVEPTLATGSAMPVRCLPPANQKKQGSLQLLVAPGTMTGLAQRLRLLEMGMPLSRASP